MVVKLFAMWLVAQAGAGFGGAPEPELSVSAAPTTSAADPLAATDIEPCVYQDDDGVWRACPLPDDDAPSAEEAPETPAAPEPPPLTKLELALQRARIDPALHPLVALRVEKARVDEALERLIARGASPSRKLPLETERDALQLVVDHVERIALSRMENCLQRQGKPSRVKNFRMTAAGPVMLTTAEILSQASGVDPEGCARIDLIDDAVIRKVKRVQELQHILKTTSFPYRRVAERRALEEELDALQRDLGREVMPALYLPGGSDPGRR